MADYYPLISRAVEALSDKSPDMRGAVYDRARTALLEQLRSLEPPLSEADITRERVALDDAIHRIEIDYGGEPEAEPPEAPGAAILPEPPPAHFSDPVHHDGAEQERFEREHHAANGDHSPNGEHWPEAEAHTEPRPAARPAGFSLPEPKRRPEIDDFIAAPAAEEAGPESAQRERPRVDTVAPRRSSGGGRRAAILGSALVLVIGAIGFTAYSLRDAPSSVPAPVATPAAPQADADGKIAERVGGERPSTAPANPAPAQPAPTPAPARNDVAVAQRAVIYEENAANPQQPNATAGRALWRVDAINAGQGQPLETAVRATVEIPDAGLTLNLLMRRNLDPTLPASHTIELSFVTQGEEARRVRDVGLLQLKNEEAVRGAPIAGLPVPVKDNLFLIGLSNLQSDMDRNKDLLTRRNWIDLPIRLAGGQRAIVSFEKGVSGDQVLTQAFRQWDEQATPAGATR